MRNRKIIVLLWKTLLVSILKIFHTVQSQNDLNSSTLKLWGENLFQYSNGFVWKLEIPNSFAVTKHHGFSMETLLVFGLIKFHSTKLCFA